MNKLIIFLVLLSGLYSCQKKSEVTADPSQAVFTISSPVPGHIYHAGDTVHISASISYPAELHGYELKITDTITGNIVYDDAQHVHSDHFDVSAVYVPSGTQPLGLRLQLIAEVDHNGSVAQQMVRFAYQP